MIIDKTNIVTKIIGIICAIGAAYGIFMTVRGFNYYMLIIALSNAILAFVCLKGFGKDKECCVGVFGFMAVFEIIRVFLEESLTLSSGVFLLLRILGYIAIVSYLLGIVKNKIIPIVGGGVVTFFMIRNLYFFVANIRNLQSMLGTNTNLFSGVMIINMIGMITYIIPALAMTILIAVGATKFTK